MSAVRAEGYRAAYCLLDPAAGWHLVEVLSDLKRDHFDYQNATLGPSALIPNTKWILARVFSEASFLQVERAL
ncbi:MAG: hypothetical protein ACUVWX_03390 [Kiritimatiellia bacterium]